MKIKLKTPRQLPPPRLFFLLILSLLSALFYMQNARQTPTKPAELMISPLPEPRIETAVPGPVEKIFTIEKNQTFTDLMLNQGFDNQTIHEIYEKTKDAYDLKQIRAGKEITVKTSPGGAFLGMQYSLNPTETLVVENSEGEIRGSIQKYEIETRVEEVGSVIEGSLYNTIDELGEPDELVTRFADIFDYDVDFIRDLQEGDSFRILYEKRYVQDQPYEMGNILAAQLINKGHVYIAIGFQTDQGWEFFSPDGKAMKKAFLASPLKFTRISSRFSTRRFHPILGGYRAHLGIDYAAPVGTPVRAIGKGKIVLAGWAGGAGRSIKIQHNKEISTVYCHLLRFAAGIRSGATVAQGQIIGYVGSTGLSTGPHLDFRYLKNGRYVNFLTIKSPQAEPLSDEELARFKQISTELEPRLVAVELRDKPVQYGFAPVPATRFTQ